MDGLEQRQQQHPNGLLQIFDADDSGIESISRNGGSRASGPLLASRMSDYTNLGDIHEFLAESDRIVWPRRRQIRIDDILWFICFALTFLCFNIPEKILFHRKIDWFYIKAMFFAGFLMFSMVPTFRISEYFFQDWTLQNRGFFSMFASLLLLSIGFFFCLGTWQVYNIWSIYIAIVSTMAFLSLVSII